MRSTCEAAPFLDVPCHHQQAVDDLREPVDLGIGRFELVSRVGAARLVQRRLQPELHPGERRAQLMRCVRDELALRPHRAFQSLGHLVERTRHLVHLGRALDRADAHREIAVAEIVRRDRQLLQRPGERSGKSVREHETCEQACGPHEGEAGPRTPGCGRDLLRVTRQPDSAHDPFVDDRRGGVHVVVAVAGAIANLRDGVSLQGCVDLRPEAIRKVRPLRCAGAVVDDDAVQIGHNDSVDLRRRCAADPGQRIGVADVLGADVRGEGLGGDERVGGELVCAAARQPDRQRNRQRDDHREQDVGDRPHEPRTQRRAPAFAHGPSSEAANRNPTPRTVTM